MKIAVDAMGGDNAPKAIVEGVMLAQAEYPDIEFLLFGKQDEIQKYVTDDSRISIIHTDEKINSDDEPVKAVRSKKNSSMVLAAKAVKDKEADAIFSAGNTGALLACGLFVVGRIKNIERPGLMTTMPVMKSGMDGFDFMDMGANAENKPEHIAQYAVLGSYYAKNVRGIENPTVGLLNNGTEDSKGSELTKTAYRLLTETKDINFIGNVEARDLLSGVCDVVVTDGFTGNAVLKTMEGTALSIMDVLKDSILESGVKGKLGAVLLKDALRTVKHSLDYSSHGGAVLFGVKAPVVKTHGSTGPEAVKYTIRQIQNMVNSGVIPSLTAYFEEKK